tara:strand:- start:884 stop:1306 length:423 start_codon:yes stop_codon:yes gene_type:complete
LITYFVSLINKFVTVVSTFFKKNRIFEEDARLLHVSNKNETKPEPKIIILKKGEKMETNLDLTNTEKTLTPLESAIERALLFGENMYFSTMAFSTSESLTDPEKAPPNLTPEAYTAFCEYTAQLFATAAAARQELNGISA